MSVQWNNKNTMQGIAASSFSGAMSVTAGGSNLAAFAVVCYVQTGGVGIASVTYGGIAMTSCGPAQTNGGLACVQIFYLTTAGGLLTGSNTLVVTGDANTAAMYVNVVSFTGVNQTTPVRPGTFNNSTGTNLSPSLTIT